MATCTAAISKAAGAFMSQTLPILEHEVESVGGTVPSWLQGTLVRNVPNTYEMGKDQVWSWTDAFPSIHLLKFNGSNTVLHTARDLMSNSVAKAVEENGIPFVLFMTPKNGGPRPTGGHLPFPCFGGPCLADPTADQVANRSSLALEAEVEHWRQLQSGPEGLSAGFKVEPANNPNVDIARYVVANGTEMYMGLTDQTVYTAFDVNTAQTIDPGPCPWHDTQCDAQLADAKLSAAHEKFDFNTKEHFNFQGNFGFPFSKDSYQMWSFKDGSDRFERKMGPTFSVDHISFVHSSHLTKDSFIIQQPPVNYNFMDLLLKKPAYNASSFHPEIPVLWHVIDRDTGALNKTYSAKDAKWVGPHGSLSKQTMYRGSGDSGAFFHTHTVNAMENDTSIVMDFVGFPDNAIFYGIGLELLLDNPRDYMETWGPARLTRCTVTKSTEAVECEILVDVNFGLPAFNIERFQTKPYNFVYATSVYDTSTSDFVDQLIKVDIDKRAVTATWREEGTFVTEPVFVARPDGTDEDDGVLLSVVFDPAQGKDGLSFVIILDAKDFKEIARLQLGCKIQAHYHGKFCKHYGDRTCVGH